MRGGPLWFIAGIIATVIVINGETNDVIGIVFGLIASIAAFVGALGLGPLAVVVLLVGIFVGIHWSERSRGRQEADAAWQRRNAYRK